MKAIAAHFEARTGHKVLLSSGSSGRHYTQILNGAPFDIFLSADSVRPKRLQQAFGLAGRRFTYAIGRLVLWSPQSDLIDSEGAVLAKNNYRYLAIANPKHAPYGKAAQQSLQALGLWRTVNAKLVRGENITQAYQFVSSGNAELGFVSYAQLVSPQSTVVGSYWLVPQDLYMPIEQQAIQLTNKLAARELMSFLQSDPMIKLMQQYGYAAPNVD